MSASSSQPAPSAASPVMTWRPRFIERPGPLDNFASQSHFERNEYPPPEGAGQSGSKTGEKVGPYACLYASCASDRVSFWTKSDLERHIADVHSPREILRFDCPEAGCFRKGIHGFNRKDKVFDHVREVHKRAVYQSVDRTETTDEYSKVDSLSEIIHGPAKTASGVSDESSRARFKRNGKAKDKTKLSTIFARGLIRSLKPTEQISLMALKATWAALIGCLCEFNDMIRYRAESGPERDAVSFVDTSFVDIADQCTELLEVEAYARYKDESQSHGDRVAAWRDGASGNPDETSRPPDDQGFPHLLHQNNDTKDEEALLSPEARAVLKFLTEGAEYQWLLHQLKSTAETECTGDTLTRIRSELSDLVGSCRSYVYHVDWNPVTFLQEQYDDPGEMMMKSVNCISGSAHIAEATACEQYVKRMWPAVGPAVLDSLSVVVQGGVGAHSFSSSFISKIFVTNTGLILYAAGSRAEIVEVGEVLSWLGAACRPSQSTNSVQYCTPSTHSLSRNTCKIGFSFSEIDHDIDVAPDSQCWREIFRNPTIAWGYPVAKRDNQETGLEVPLELAANLGQTSYATTFRGMFLLKGFCSALVPTRKTDTSMVWHYMLSPKFAYLTYNAALKTWDKKLFLDSSCLKALRHFVGWTKESETSIGTKDAAYHQISYAGSCQSAPRGVGIKELQIGASFYFQASCTIVPGKKDRRIPVSNEFPFTSHVDQARSTSVVIFDVGQRQGWLINGAELVLLLIRTWMSHPSALLAERGRANEAVASFRHLNSDVENRDSAFQILTHPKNQRVEFRLEDSQLSDEEGTSDSGSQANSTPDVWRFRDLVLSYCNTLQKLQAHRADLLNEGQWNATPAASRTLQGFCFMEILKFTPVLRSRSVSLASPTWLRVTEAIDAVNIVGKGFGQLIRSVGSSCECQAKLPSGKDLLITQLGTLKEIAPRRGNIYEKCVNIVDDVFWHDPATSFDRKCGKGTSKQGTCHAYITRFASCQKKCQQPTRVPSAGIFDIYPNAAIIIGHNKKLLKSRRVKEEDDDGVHLSDDESRRSSFTSDSAIGMGSPSNSSGSRSSGSAPSTISEE